MDFGELALYGVVTGDVSTNHGWGNPYPFLTRPSVPKDSKSCSALWRGYTADFILASDGSLTLDAYKYNLAPKGPRQSVDERLSGDFWLLMKSEFGGKRVYVPFHAGRIVADQDKWVVEGNDSLETLKHPKRPKWFEPKNIPLSEPVFIGVISRVDFDEVLQEDPWVVLDREIPRHHCWCEVQIRRDNAPIAETKICGSSGGDAGPWMLEPIELTVQVGDHVFALARLPSDDEVKQQMASKET